MLIYRYLSQNRVKARDKKAISDMLCDVEVKSSFALCSLCRVRICEKDKLVQRLIFRYTWDRLICTSLHRSSML